MPESIMLIVESNAAHGNAPQVRSRLESIVERTRDEDGCLRYELVQDLDDDNHIILIEEWRDQTALDAHLAQAHVNAVFQSVMPLVADEGRLTRVRPIV